VRLDPLIFVILPIIKDKSDIGCLGQAMSFGSEVTTATKVLRSIHIQQLRKRHIMYLIFRKARVSHTICVDTE
jgi:hypothetical protein